MSRARQERGEHWTSSVSKEVALKAAGSSSWHWDSDSDIPALPHALACYRYCLSPSSQAQKDKEGPRRQSRIYLCSLYAHTLDPSTLLLQFISRARHSTGNSWAAAHCKDNQSFCSSGREIPLQSPSHPQQGLSCFIHLIFGRTGSAVTFPIL